MLKVLLKKQLLEIFRSYFYDTKKNTARKKIFVITYFVLFAVLLIGFMGGIFTFLSVSLCTPLYLNGTGWLYFAFMALISVLLGVFGTVFNTYQSLYNAKDNDLILSMPIPVRTVMVSRMLGAYIMSAMYSGVVILPAVIVYIVLTPFKLSALFGGILLFLLITVFVLTISCILGWVVAKISAKLKNRSFITVLVALVFLALYYVVCFKAESIITDLITNSVIYGSAVKEKAYLVYVIGSVGVGNVLSMLIVTLAVIAMFLAVYAVLSRSFLKIATADNSRAKKKYNAKSLKSATVFGALFKKELKKFTSSPNYMLNCALGTVFLPIAGVLILVYGGVFRKELSAFLSGDIIAVILLCSICAMSSFNDITAPSVSLEGKSIWIAQSLPVSGWEVLRTKLCLHLVLTELPVLFCGICASVFLSADFVQTVLIIFIPMLFVLLFATLGLVLNLKMPNLNWTNETVPVKQGASVAIAMFGGFGVTAIFGGIYYLAYLLNIPLYLYAIFIIALLTAVNIMLLNWLKTRGSTIFSAL